MEDFKGTTVLVVDDEPDLREILADEFTFAGARVLTAENGKSAFEIVKRERIDAVVSDIRMPGGSGVELLENIRKTHPVKPIVVLMTGYADLSSEDAFHKGAEGVFAKPCDLDDVLKCVKKALVSAPLAYSQRPYRFQFKATVICKDVSSEATFNKNVLNIGRGGFCVLFEQNSPKVGKTFDFEMQLVEPRQTKIRGRCICRWARTQSTSAEPIAAGFEFLDLDLSSQEILKSLNSDFTIPAFIPKE